jgi:hypothetical protein
MSALRCRATARAKVAAFVFPRYDPLTETARLAQLSPADIYARLVAQHLPEPFGQPGYWRSWLKEAPEASDHRANAFIAWLATAVSAYELVQNQTVNVDAASLIARLASADRGSEANRL